MRAARSAFVMPFGFLLDLWLIPSSLFMLEHDFDGQAVTDQALVDEIVEDKLLLETLLAALAELTVDERSLIDALFYQEKSEREVAKETGVPQTTINYQKNRILNWLKKKLK